MVGPHGCGGAFAFAPPIPSVVLPAVLVVFAASRLTGLIERRGPRSPGCSLASTIPPLAHRWTAESG